MTDIQVIYHNDSPELKVKKKWSNYIATQGLDWTKLHHRYLLGTFGGAWNNEPLGKKRYLEIAKEVINQKSK